MILTTHFPIKLLVYISFSVFVCRYVLKVKGVRSTDGQLQNSRGDVKYSMGNMVNNTVGARWVLGISGKHFIKYVIV